MNLEETKCPINAPLKWYGCYSGEAKYKRYLDEDTNAHPAKMSMGLARPTARLTVRVVLPTPPFIFIIEIITY